MKDLPPTAILTSVFSGLASAPNTAGDIASVAQNADVTISPLIYRITFPPALNGCIGDWLHLHRSTHDGRMPVNTFANHAGLSAARTSLNGLQRPLVGQRHRFYRSASLSSLSLALPRYARITSGCFNTSSGCPSASIRP